MGIKSQDLQVFNIIGKSSSHFQNNNQYDDKYSEGEEEMFRIRKKHESIKERLTKINRISNDLEASKKEFLKIISHEVRTPLNGIVGSIELMKLDLPDNIDNTLFHILDDSVKRLEKFCLDALLLTKFRLGEPVIKFNSVNIQTVLENAIQVNIQALTDKKIEVIQNAEYSPAIYADEKLLARCFGEIIENSVRNSPCNSIIKVSIRRKNRFLQIEFKDYGRGFSETAIKNLFKVFTRDQEFVDTNIGLGLTLVKSIITEHEGSVDIKNHDNGALVSLSLPIPGGERLREQSYN